MNDTQKLGIGRWVAESLSLGNLIQIALLLFGIIGGYFTMSARVTALEQTQLGMLKRQDDTDRKFDRLPQQYVPRTELQGEMSDMKEDLRDIKTDLRTMQRK